jgi:hypothetical protein
MIMRPTSRRRTAQASRAGRKLTWAPLVAVALVAQSAAGAQAGTTAPGGVAATQPRSGLSSVSCLSSSSCLSVGFRVGHLSHDVILAEGWTGQAWSLLPVLNPRHTQNNDINSLACTSATQCFGVGSVGSFNTANHELVIEKWDGTSWVLQSIGNPSGTANTFLTSVSCGGPALCFATGDKNDNTGMQPGVMLEGWNGTAWSVQPPLPQPSGALGITMPGVSCVSTSDCTGVGVSYTPQFVQSTLAEHWNGQQWSIEPMPPLGKGNQPQLFSVSCSSGACLAIGLDFINTGVSPLAEWFNGTSWSVVPPATPAGATNFSLNGVDCTSAANCYAVGSSSNASNVVSTLIEQWNGHAWTVAASPDPAGSPVLLGVSCSSGTSCMAVGQTMLSSTSNATVAMRLSGGAWTITPTPSPG